MIRVNPEPQQGGHAFIPSGAVTAYFPPDKDLNPLMRELAAAESHDDRIDVFTGKEGLVRLDPEGRRQGQAVRLVNAVVETFFDDFQEFKKAEETLQSGGSVVAAFTLSDDEKKARVARILKAHGGNNVIYWGPLVREYL